MQQVNGVPVLSSDPSLLYIGLEEEPTWFSAQGGVYKCIERSSEKEVAIKKYLVEENQYEDMFVMPKELVENEIYSMTKCVHPNILKLFAVHLHEEFVYLVMPLYTGGSLQHYAFDHQLSLGQLVYVITAIVSGLAKVHSHGYIHRDMKCDNIFLDKKTNSIVIGDFGVVSISPVADSSIEEAGVVLFWSPELVLQKIVNHKIDIWALGIVILEMLNGGKAPYEDENLDEDQIKERILSVGKPKYPPNLPNQLVDLLDCCLDPDPRKRSSAQQLLQHPFLKAYPPEPLFPTTALAPVTLTEPERPFKCRLPIPSFSVDRSISAAIPVREKIASVIQKRQSMTDTNRSQGSRIPMLSVPKKLSQLAPPPPVSAQFSTLAPKSSFTGARTLLQKPQLTRSNTVPTRIEQPPMRQLRSPISLQSSTRSIQPSSYLTTDRKIERNRPKKEKVKRELPPKCSVYRKRLPAGESRTARLTMGVSTNARRQSYRQREEEVEEVIEMTPTLGRSARLLKPPKQRPQSFAPSHSTINHSLIPESIKSSTVKSKTRRQSVPVPSKTMDPKKKGDHNNSTSNSSSSSSSSSSNSKEDANSLKNSIKALRVH